jgi:hypothetical protein
LDARPYPPDTLEDYLELEKYEGRFESRCEADHANLLFLAMRKQFRGHDEQKGRN